MDVKRDIVRQGMRVGQFINWGSAVSVDKARKLLRVLPEFQGESTVEIDSEGIPDDEQLAQRLSSY